MKKNRVTPPNVRGVMLPAFHIICPSCEKDQFFVSTLEVLAVIEAKDHGWVNIDPIWICPDCAKLRQHKNEDD
jgi:hypothetical protein